MDITITCLFVHSWKTIYEHKAKPYQYIIGVLVDCINFSKMDWNSHTLVHFLESPFLMPTDSKFSYSVVIQLQEILLMIPNQITVSVVLLHLQLKRLN